MHSIARFKIGSHKLISILSVAIILMGLAHIGFAFFVQISTNLIWFVASGTAIVFSGLLNLIALERGGSKFSKAIGFIVNGINCLVCCLVVLWFKSPLQFFGMLLFLTTTIAFFVDWKRQPL